MRDSNQRPRSSGGALSRLLRALALVISVATPGRSLEAQAFDPGTPEAGAAAFYASFQQAQWAEMAEVLHPEALALFQERLLQVVRADATGQVARRVFGAEPTDLEAMPPSALFARLLRGVLSYAPGMMQAMTSKRVAIMGHVVEGAEARAALEGGAPGSGPVAHVVIRSREPLSGTAPSRVGVLSLARDREVWKVTWAEELDVIATALVAVPIPGETTEDFPQPRSDR